MAEQARLESLVGSIDTEAKIRKLFGFIEKRFSKVLSGNKGKDCFEFDYTKLAVDELRAVNEFVSNKLN